MSNIANPAASALSAFAVGMQVSAHNIANISTPEFNAQSVSYTTGPNGRGVMAEVFTQSSVGVQKGDYYADTAAVSPSSVLPQGNNVSVAREFTSMMVTENAFDANVATLRSLDDMSSILLDIKV